MMISLGGLFYRTVWKLRTSCERLCVGLYKTVPTLGYRVAHLGGWFR